jgi:tetratricopeptide (TPR) repeat protein
MRFTMIPVFLIQLAVGTYAVTDSTMALFEQGIATWDTFLLKSAFTASTREAPHSDFVFKATCYWRLQVISYLNGNKQGMINHGVRALNLLDSAALKGEDQFLVTARRAYVSQLMAGTSLINGPKYGPHTAKYLEEMKKNKPDGFDTRFIEAVNLLEMPSFVGGNPKKAQELLLEVYKDFPDSPAVALRLARAMIKNKRKEEARKVLDQVLRKDPKNLWARKVRGEIR